MTSAFNFLLTLRVAAAAASALGYEEEAASFAAQFTAAAALYNARFYNATSLCYGDGSQVPQIYPLFLDIVPQSEAARVFESCLLAAIAAPNPDDGGIVGHLATGIISTRYLMPLLSRFRRTDVALGLALGDSYPVRGSLGCQKTAPCPLPRATMRRSRGGGCGRSTRRPSRSTGTHSRTPRVQR